MFRNIVLILALAFCAIYETDANTMAKIDKIDPPPTVEPIHITTKRPAVVTTKRPAVVTTKRPAKIITTKRPNKQNDNNKNKKINYEIILNNMSKKKTVPNFYINRPECEIDEIAFTNNYIVNLHEYERVNYTYVDNHNHQYNYSTINARLYSTVLIKISPWFQKSMGTDKAKLNYNANVQFLYTIGRRPSNNPKHLDSRLKWDVNNIVTENIANDIILSGDKKDCGNILSLVEFKKILFIRPAFYQVINKAVSDEISTQLVTNRVSKFFAKMGIA